MSKEGSDALPGVEEGLEGRQPCDTEVQGGADKTGIAKRKKKILNTICFKNKIL